MAGSSRTAGFETMRQKYGDIYSMLFGQRRTIVISDFDLIQEMGAKEELSDRIVSKVNITSLVYTLATYNIRMS